MHDTDHRAEYIRATVRTAVAAAFLVAIIIFTCVVNGSSSKAKHVESNFVRLGLSGLLVGYALTMGSAIPEVLRIAKTLMLQNGVVLKDLFLVSEAGHVVQLRSFAKSGMMGLLTLAIVCTAQGQFFQFLLSTAVESKTYAATVSHTNYYNYARPDAFSFKKFRATRNWETFGPVLSAYTYTTINSVPAQSYITSESKRNNALQYDVYVGETGGNILLPPNYKRKSNYLGPEPFVRDYKVKMLHITGSGTANASSTFASPCGARPATTFRFLAGMNVNVVEARGTVSSNGSAVTIQSCLTSANTDSSSLYVDNNFTITFGTGVVEYQPYRGTITRVLEFTPLPPDVMTESNMDALVNTLIAIRAAAFPGNSFSQVCSTTSTTTSSDTFPTTTGSTTSSGLASSMESILWTSEKNALGTESSRLPHFFIRNPFVAASVVLMTTLSDESVGFVQPTSIPMYVYQDVPRVKAGVIAAVVTLAGLVVIYYGVEIVWCCRHLKFNVKFMADCGNFPYCYGSNVNLDNATMGAVMKSGRLERVHLQLTDTGGVAVEVDNSVPAVHVVQMNKGCH